MVETPEDLLALPTKEFEAVVRAETRRSGVSDEIAKALRSPLVVERWRNALADFVDRLNGELSERKAELAKLQAVSFHSHRPTPQYLEAKVSFEEWHSKVVRHLTTLRERLREAKTLATNFNRQRAELRVDELKRAIRLHRAEVMAGDFEPSETDRDLWAVLDNYI